MKIILAAAAMSFAVSGAMAAETAADRVIEELGLGGGEWNSSEIREDGWVMLQGFRWESGAAFFETEMLVVQHGADGTVGVQAEGMRARIGALSLSADAVSIEGARKARREGRFPEFRMAEATGTMAAWYGTAFMHSGAVSLSVSEWGREGLPEIARIAAEGELPDGTAGEGVVSLTADRRTSSVNIDASFRGMEGSALARLRLDGIGASWKAQFAGWLNAPSPLGTDLADRIASEASVASAAFAFRGFPGAGEAAGSMAWGSRALQWLAVETAGRLGDGDVGLVLRPGRPLTLWSIFSPGSYIAPPAFGAEFR